MTIIDGAEPAPKRTGLTALITAGVVVSAVGGLALLGFFDGSEPTTQAQPPTTTTTEPTTTTLSTAELALLEHEADVELIEQLWWEQSTAWTFGFERGVEFWVDNNYPDMACSYDDYMRSWFPDGPIEGLNIERIVNSPTVEGDDGWLIPGGKLEGVRAKGRVYVMSVTDTFTAPDLQPESPAIRKFHVTVLDGRAHFFVGCSA